MFSVMPLISCICGDVSYLYGVTTDPCGLKQIIFVVQITPRHGVTTNLYGVATILHGITAIHGLVITNLCFFIYFILFIYLGFLRCFQHCTGHITMGSWKGRGNQYIQFVRVLYCKLPTNGNQLPAFPLEAMLGIEPRPQR